MDGSDENLYKSIANRLVGYWYNYQNDEVLIFSLADLNTGEGSVEIRKNDITITTTFQLLLQPNKGVYLTIRELLQLFHFTLKIITGDTLIFQDDALLYIYERRITHEFANQLISSFV